MPKLTRRSFVNTAATTAALSASGVSLFPRRARAADFSWKLANNAPASHPLTVRAMEAAERIRMQTNGAVDIQLFPNNQLGGDTDVLSQLRSGAVEMFQLSGLILSILVPTSSINGIGFAFKDYGQVWSAMDGDLGAYIRGSIDKAGIYTFDKIWDNGYRQITSSTHPINTPDDLKGFKIRVPVSPLWTSMFKAFGASPASINLSEVYSALQTKIVEGQENPLSLIQSTKFYEVQKYISTTSHMWDGYWCLANKRTWLTLPADLREIVAKNINMSAEDQRGDIAKLNSSLQSQLEKEGITFNKPDPELFRAVLKKAGFYNEWRDKYGADAWAVLEKYSGPLI